MVCKNMHQLVGCSYILSPPMPYCLKPKPIKYSRVNLCNATCYTKPWRKETQPLSQQQARASQCTMRPVCISCRAAQNPASTRFMPYVIGGGRTSAKREAACLYFLLCSAARAEAHRSLAKDTASS